MQSFPNKGRDGAKYRVNINSNKRFLEYMEKL